MEYRGAVPASRYADIGSSFSLESGVREYFRLKKGSYVLRRHNELAVP
jgi:hypothetical protein